MITPEIVLETSTTNYEATSPAIDVDSEKTKSIAPGWLEDQVIKYFLPLLKS